jgi:hypothetical protein
LQYEITSELPLSKPQKIYPKPSESSNAALINQLKKTLESERIKYADGKTENGKLSNDIAEMTLLNNTLSLSNNNEITRLRIKLKQALKDNENLKTKLVTLECKLECEVAEKQKISEELIMIQNKKLDLDLVKERKSKGKVEFSNKTKIREIPSHSDINHIKELLTTKKIESDFATSLDPISDRNIVSDQENANSNFGSMEMEENNNNKKLSDLSDLKHVDSFPELLIDENQSSSQIFEYDDLLKQEEKVVSIKTAPSEINKGIEARKSNKKEHINSTELKKEDLKMNRNKTRSTAKAGKEIKWKPSTKQTGENIQLSNTIMIEKGKSEKLPTIVSESNTVLDDNQTEAITKPLERINVGVTKFQRLKSGPIIRKGNATTKENLVKDKTMPYAKKKNESKLAIIKSKDVIDETTHEFKISEIHSKDPTSMKIANPIDETHLISEEMDDELPEIKSNQIIDSEKSPVESDEEMVELRRSKSFPIKQKIKKVRKRSYSEKELDAAKTHLEYRSYVGDDANEEYKMYIKSTKESES